MVEAEGIDEFEYEYDPNETEVADNHMAFNGGRKKFCYTC